MLKLKKHIEYIFQKASQKTNALQGLHHTWEQPKNVLL